LVEEEWKEDERIKIRVLDLSKYYKIIVILKHADYLRSLC